jgi:hypothetical protein
LGKNASEADAEEIIEMASKASVADQQMVVQENVHSQIKAFCTIMDEVLLPNEKIVSDDSFKLSQQTNILPQHSELSSANGRCECVLCNPQTNNPAEIFCFNFYFVYLSFGNICCSLLGHQLFLFL